MSSTRFTPPVPTFEEVGPAGASYPDSDGLIYPGENDYARQTNKRTLGSYISSLTRGEVPTVNVVEYNGPVPTHGNAYPVGDASGNPNFTFTQLGIEGGSVNELDSYSNSGLFDIPAADGDLASIIKKGKLGEGQGQEALSGHELLPGVVGTSTVGGIVTPRSAGAKAYLAAIPEILADKNLYDPTRTATSTVNESDVYLASFRNSVQQSEENLSNSFSSSTVGIETLSKVAIDIMLKATGKSNGPDEYGSILAGLTPSGVQYGTSRVDSESLRARTYSGVAGLSSTLDETGPVNLPVSDGVGEDRYTNKSYGVTYNPLEGFSDLTSGVTSFTLLAATATAAVFAVLGIFSFKGVGEAGSDFPTYRNFSANTGRNLQKGAFSFAKDEPEGFLSKLAAAGVDTDIAKILNFYSPSNGLADYGSCVVIGFASLLGAKFNDDDIIRQNLDGEFNLDKIGIKLLLGSIGLRFLAIALTSEKGNYLNLFREIMKDSGNLVANIGDVGLTNLIPSLTQSKVVRFVDTLAKIGDLVLLQARAKTTYKFNDSFEPEDPYRNSFKIDGSNAKRFAMQRIRGTHFGSKRGASLGVEDIPSAHLVPKSYQNLINDGRFSSFAITGSNGRTNLRLTQDDVRELENILDAEYMPFYFQDLRTNEIVSFHAFLDELSDSYSAEYNSTSGYGRIEDIKMYKSTKRSVGCTFHIIATNEKDFDYMWWQINKLTTMVYPQWSQGRKINTKVNDLDFNFIQPFSQVPNATPVIRLRVGDLIRSNYSRFNLKRLFGYYDPTTKQNSDVPVQHRYFAYAGFYKDDRTSESIKVNDLIDLGIRTSEPTPSSEAERVGRYVLHQDAGTGRLLQIPLGDIRSVGVSATPNELSKQFYSVDNNAIVRSFESTMGMGLAAVVTQLQFTWMEALWGAGEDGPGKRAPRSCKVQMSFEPIHDIAPGLDHEGFNRAPIYPVGEIINKVVEGDEAQNPYGNGTFKRSDLKKDIDSVNTKV